MGEFFKPWRRKIGVMTLMLACLFAAGWVRCRFIQDTYTFSFWTPSCVKVISAPHCLVLAKLQVETDKAIPLSVWQSEQADAKHWHLRFDGATVNYPIREAAFTTDDVDFGIGNTNVSVKFCQLPYWSMTIPLTLIALGMLVINPRKLNEKKMAEPNSEMLT